MQLKGLLHSKSEAVQVSDKFKKRDFIVQVAGEYPQFIALQLSQAKCDLIDKIQLGQEITCHINLRGRLWIDPKANVEKCFNTLEVWKIENGAAKIEAPAAGKAADDLPF